MQKEIDFLGNAVNNPEDHSLPTLVEKGSSKISVITSLTSRYFNHRRWNGLYLLAKSSRRNIGISLCEDDYLEYALEMNKSSRKGVKLLLPQDDRIGDAFSNDCNIQIVKSGRNSGRLGRYGHRT